MMNKPPIVISPLVHRGAQRIKVECPFDEAAISQIKKIEGRLWSKTHGCWHVPYTAEAYQQLKEMFEVEVPEEFLKKEAKARAGKIQESPIPIAEPVQSQKRGTVKPKRSVPQLAALPAISVNKLNIQPNAIAQVKRHIYNGREYSTVTGESVVISKRGDHFLEAYVPYYKKGWVEEIKAIAGRVWSPESKCWLLPYVAKTIACLYRSFGEKVVFNFRPSDAIPVEWTGITDNPKKESNTLAKDHQECIVALEEQLMLERKSYSTIKGYRNNLRRFLEFYGSTPPTEITERQIKDYLLYLVNEKGISESTQNQVINSIKAFFEKVLKQERKTYYIPRPKKRNSLPNVLSEREVINLLQAVDNKKHQCILMVIYSAGLRLGELVNLKIRDLDFDRMRIFVHAGKGKKDRYTLLSQKAIFHLDKYMREYRPTGWLFEGQDCGQYSKSSVQKIFKKACRKAGIKKPATVHTLRHSFATHLLDKKISLRHIQGLLGHESSKTTEIYTHLTTEGFGSLKSPLDDLNF